MKGRGPKRLTYAAAYAEILLSMRPHTSAYAHLQQWLLHDAIYIFYCLNELFLPNEPLIYLLTFTTAILTLFLFYFHESPRQYVNFFSVFTSVVFINK